jgi:hypothetical protein
MKIVYGFKPWDIYVLIENHKRLEEQMALKCLNERKIIILDGKIICYKIKKVKVIQ